MYVIRTYHIYNIIFTPASPIHMLFGASNTCYIHQVRSRGWLQVTRKSNSPRNPAIDEDEDEEPEVEHVVLQCFWFCC